MGIEVDFSQFEMDLKILWEGISATAVQDKLTRIADEYSQGLGAYIDTLTSPKASGRMKAVLTEIIPVWKTPGGYAIGIGRMDMVGDPMVDAPPHTIADFLRWQSKESEKLEKEAVSEREREAQARGLERAAQKREAEREARMEEAAALAGESRREWISDRLKAISNEFIRLRHAIDDLQRQWLQLRRVGRSEDYIESQLGPVRESLRDEWEGLVREFEQLAEELRGL